MDTVATALNVPTRCVQVGRTEKDIGQTHVIIEVTDKGPFNVLDMETTLALDYLQSWCVRNRGGVHTLCLRFLDTPVPHHSRSEDLVVSNIDKTGVDDTRALVHKELIPNCLDAGVPKELCPLAVVIARACTELKLNAPIPAFSMTITKSGDVAVRQTIPGISSEVLSKVTQFIGPDPAASLVIELHVGTSEAVFVLTPKAL